MEKDVMWNWLTGPPHTSDEDMFLSSFCSSMNTRDNALYLHKRKEATEQYMRKNPRFRRFEDKGLKELERRHARGEVKHWISDFDDIIKTSTKTIFIRTGPVAHLDEPYTIRCIECSRDEIEREISRLVGWFTFESNLERRMSNALKAMHKDFMSRVILRTENDIARLCPRVRELSDLYNGHTVSYQLSESYPFSRVVYRAAKSLLKLVEDNPLYWVSTEDFEIAGICYQLGLIIEKEYTLRVLRYLSIGTTIPIELHKEIMTYVNC